MLCALPIFVNAETGAGFHWDRRENGNVGHCYREVHFIGNGPNGRSHQTFSRKRVAIPRSKHSGISIAPLKMKRIVLRSDQRCVRVNDNRSVNRFYRFITDLTPSRCTS